MNTPQNSPGPTLTLRFAAAAACLVLAGCAREQADEPAAAGSAARESPEDLDRFRMRHIGAPVGDKPWVAHVRAVDLDADGLTDAIACESKDDTVVWLRQVEGGGFEERIIAEDMRAPVHAEAVDLDQDGDLDLVVSSMSVVFPNNDRIGAVFALENQGNQEFIRHVLIEDTDRVVDARPADFDGDGRIDLAVAQFGYDQGQVSWMRRTGPWSFDHKTLLSLSGTVNVCVADFDLDGDPDFAAQVSQQWEEIHFFENDGRGNFRNRIIWGSTNEDYSSSGMTAADLDQDGYTDLIFTNGDGFGPTALPGPKPWHGVQWLRNLGGGVFEFSRIGSLGGAYSPAVADLDGDGDQDVVALSSFNDWSDPKAESLVWFRQNTDGSFTRKILAYTPTHLLTVDIAEFGGSAAPDLITGGFHAYPPYIEENMSRLAVWTAQRP